MQDYANIVAKTALLSLTPEPKTLNRALRDLRWVEAMQHELTMKKNNTWQLVPRPPLINIIGSKWVYHIKTKDDGTIDHFKAHLVAKGFAQISGTGYDETFSPVI